jgi:hypothetical protein
MTITMPTDTVQESPAKGTPPDRIPPEARTMEVEPTGGAAKPEKL